MAKRHRKVTRTCALCGRRRVVYRNLLSEVTTWGGALVTSREAAVCRECAEEHMPRDSQAEALAILSTLAPKKPEGIV